jgi:hypothetical protein
MAVAVEGVGKLAVRRPDWLPAFSLIGCAARQFNITGSSGTEVVHQNVPSAQVVPDGIQVMPGAYFCHFETEVGEDRVVAIHRDGGCRGIDIGSAVRIASPADKSVTLFGLGDQVYDAALSQVNVASPGVITWPPSVLEAVRSYHTKVQLAIPATEASATKKMPTSAM